MSNLEQHAQSIAETAADYRIEELGEFTTDHVMRWVDQFDSYDQLPMLAELDHVLKKTYFSEPGVTEFLEHLAKEPKLVGNDPAAFWKSAGILDIQQGGNSQKDMLQRFNLALQQTVGISLDECDSSSGNFIYLDDAIFTGNRVRWDLVPWITDAAPKAGTLNVIVNALHLGGEFYAGNELKKAYSEAGKNIETRWWRVRSVENRKYYKDSSEVLWPTSIPEGDENIDAYVQILTNAGFAPQKRVKRYTPKDGVFSGEEGRAALERAFLKAGVRILSMCPYLPDTARPLGYSKLKTLGFGATVVSYRNCPNNCPLALWVSDPWYPLFRRKTN